MAVDGSAAVQAGRLALEYFAGRRRRYVPPLRLCLSASILFFVAIRLTGPSLDDAVRVDPASGERVSAPLHAAGDRRRAMALLQAAIVLWLMSYPYAELRRVYGGGRWGTFWRVNAIAVLYLLVSGSVIAAFFLYAVIS